MGEASQRRRALLCAATLIGAVGASLLVYANALGNPFLGDDPFMLLKNPTIAQPSSVALRRLWVTDYLHGILPSGALVPLFRAPTSAYRPITTFTFWAQSAAGALTPSQCRLVNVVLHGLAAWFLGAWWAMSTDLLAGTIAGSLFLVHPVATDVVNHVIGRADILAVFGIAGFLFLQRATQSWWWLAIAGTLCAAIGLGSKESGLVLVPVAVAQAWVLASPRARRSVLALALPVGAYLCGRVAAGGTGLSSCVRTEWDLTECPMAGKALLDRGATAAALAWHYLRTVAWPWPILGMDVPARFPRWTDASVWLGIGVVVALLVTACVSTLHRRVVSVAIVWWLFAFALVSQLVFPIGPYREARLAYSIVPGTLCIAGLLFATLLRRPGFSRVAAGVLMAVTALAFVSTDVRRNQEWNSERTALEADLRRVPDAPIAHLNLAANLDFHDQPADAEREFVQATMLGPAFHEPWITLAQFYERLGKLSEARQAYEHAAAVAPTLPFAPLALGTLDLNAGRFPEAEEWLTKAERLDPRNSLVQYNLAVLDTQRHRNAEAIARLERLVREDPTDRRAAEALAYLRGGPP